MKKDINSKRINKVLSDIYTNIKANIVFPNQRQLYALAKKELPNITLKHVKNFLSSQDSYTLFKLTPKKFKLYRKVLAARPKIIISLDLIDMSKLFSDNNDIKYLMLFIDVFSRKITVIPIKSKSKTDILYALQSFFASADNHKYTRIYSDLEGGLYSKLVQDYLFTNKKILYSNFSKERKNSIAENAIKFIKRKIYIYLTHYNTDRYIDALQDIVQSVNNATKSVFKNKLLTPAVLHEIKQTKFLSELFQTMYGINNDPSSKKEHLLHINQLVRIPNTSRSQNVFFKSYNIANTEEIFKIKSIDKSVLPYVYHLQDLTGKDIIGAFYRQELVPAKLKKIYPIKILKTKKVKRKTKYFISYLGWPAIYNHWIDSSRLVS